MKKGDNKKKEKMSPKQPVNIEFFHNKKKTRSVTGPSGYPGGVRGREEGLGGRGEP